MLRLADPTTKAKQSKEWVREAERMFRIDRRDPRHVREVVEWMFTHPDGSFWIANCRSPSKLRKQFETIAAQHRRSSAPKVAAAPVGRGTRASGEIKL